MNKRQVKPNHGVYPHRPRRGDLTIDCTVLLSHKLGSAPVVVAIDTWLVPFLAVTHPWQFADVRPVANTGTAFCKAKNKLTENKNQHGLKLFNSSQPRLQKQLLCHWFQSSDLSRMKQSSNEYSNTVTTASTMFPNNAVM